VRVSGLKGKTGNSRSGYIYLYKLIFKKLNK
jgi:hypothetical protein